MKEIMAHQMQYIGEKVTSSLNVIHYCDKYYDEYKTIYNNCFRTMRLALELEPDCCGTRAQLVDKQTDIYLLLEKGDMIGSVAIYKNEIDDLIVNPQYQGKGYGRQLLLYAVSNLQNRGIGPIFLHVAEWNTIAVDLYLKSGFQLIKTEKAR